MRPWLDRAGRFSPLKAGVFAALFIPALWTGAEFELGMLGGRPVKAVLLAMGLWAIRLLFLTLLITPARLSFAWPRLIAVRRMVGVAAFAYALAHLSLYIVLQGFDIGHVASEIVSHIYLTIGFAALLGLAALAATSTDAMIRRLGAKAWNRLHRLVYPIGMLAAVHFFLQVKADVAEPTMMGGLLAWLLLYRILGKLRGKGGAVPLAWVLALAPVTAALTALGEALYFWGKIGVPPLRVIGADFTFAAGIRPAQLVLAFTLAFALAAGIRLLAKRRLGSSANPRRRLDPRVA